MTISYEENDSLIRGQRQSQVALVLNKQDGGDALKWYRFLNNK